VASVAAVLSALLAACSSTSAGGGPDASSVPKVTVSPRPATDARSVSARPSAGCRTTTAPSTGSTPVAEHLVSSGVKRTYLRMVPLSYRTGRPMPLVIDLHGYLEGAVIHVQMSGLAAFGARHGFIDLTPQGTGTDVFWNASGTSKAPNDVQFIRDLIDTTSADLCVDRNRIYVTGLSLGAFMTSLVGCRLASEVAAIAPVAGLRWPAGCRPARPVPIVAFHGTADPILSYAGGYGTGAAALPVNQQAKVVLAGTPWGPVRDSLHEWAAFERCTRTVRSKVTRSVSLLSYQRCAGGSVVELYSIAGGGHAWPGSAFSAKISQFVGHTTFEISADRLIWQFFQAHPLRG